MMIRVYNVIIQITTSGGLNWVRTISFFFFQLKNNDLNTIRVFSSLNFSKPEKYENVKNNWMNIFLKKLYCGLHANTIL